MPKYHSLHYLLIAKEKTYREKIVCHHFLERSNLGLLIGLTDKPPLCAFRCCIMWSTLHDLSILDKNIKPDQHKPSDLSSSLQKIQGIEGTI